MYTLSNILIYLKKSKHIDSTTKHNYEICLHKVKLLMLTQHDKKRAVTHESLVKNLSPIFMDKIDLTIYF